MTDPFLLSSRVANNNSNDDDDYSTDTEEQKDKIDPITVLQDGIGPLLLCGVVIILNIYS